MVHSIELKFHTCIIGHRPIYCIDFVEFMIFNFLYRGTKKNSYALQPVESNYKKYIGAYGE